MKKEHVNQVNNLEDISPEYDFSQGIQGKHHATYQEGYEVIIHKTDGTTEVRKLSLPEGTVVLEPDVRTYFPDSESVNQALRGLIALVPSRVLKDS
ncbi:MAG: hypothetical protein JW981_01030 [Anaerolineae bacterium]|nr:hypothetical protein [Anaerolineae bacterium]